jgi:hypothetical protein
MASSLVNRGSFDVKPSYISGDYVGVFSQEWPDFHINAQYFTPDSPMWYSYHSFGIPLLLSPFCSRHNTCISRPWLPCSSEWCFCRRSVSSYFTFTLLNSFVTTARLWLRALTLLGSLSFFSLVGQLYSDLLTAGVLAGSLLCLARLRRNPHSLLPIAILGALAGLGPYLHVKTVLMSLTLLLLGLLHWWRNGRSKRALACLLVPAAGLLAIYAVTIHAWYDTWMITAPFSNGLLFHFAPGQSVIANLLDTSRGILPNNPAYLLILAGIPLVDAEVRATSGEL